MKKTDLAWAAGFLDGEGTFYCSKVQKVKRKYGKGFRIKAFPYFKIETTQSHREVLERLRSIVGGSISGPYYRPPSKPYFCFNVCTNAIKIFKKLFPFLSPVKRKQGLKAITKWKQRTEKLRSHV